MPRRAPYTPKGFTCVGRRRFLLPERALGRCPQLKAGAGNSLAGNLSLLHAAYSLGVLRVTTECFAAHEIEEIDHEPIVRRRLLIYLERGHCGDRRVKQNSDQAAIAGVTTDIVAAPVSNKYRYWGDCRN